jgi:hypothetical protein
MDQTNFSFDDIKKTTLSKKGQRTININKPKSKHGGRATINLCVGGDGHKLPAHIMYI